MSESLFFWHEKCHFQRKPFVCILTLIYLRFCLLILRQACRIFTFLFSESGSWDFMNWVDERKAINTSNTSQSSCHQRLSVTLTDTTTLCLKCDLLPWKRGHPLASKQPVDWILGHSCRDEGSRVCHCFSSWIKCHLFKETFSDHTTLSKIMFHMVCPYLLVCHVCFYFWLNELLFLSSFPVCCGIWAKWGGF